MSKFGIQEIEDIIGLVDYLADEMAVAMEGDGKITRKEMINAIIGEPSVVFRAIWGSWDIGDEIEDLEEDELKILLERALPVIKKFVDIFV